MSSAFMFLFPRLIAAGNRLNAAEYGPARPKLLACVAPIYPRTTVRPVPLVFICRNLTACRKADPLNPPQMPFVLKRIKVILWSALR